VAYTDNPHYQQAVTDLEQFSVEELEAMSNAVTDDLTENGPNIVAELLSNAIQDALEHKENNTL
jgi:hypothetical protein